MKKFQVLLVLITFMGLILIGCSDKLQSPVEPTDQNSTVSLDKKGPVVHSVNGSGLFFFNGKNAGVRYAAHEYSDGTFNGNFELNSANATGDHDFKLNGEVISFKIYENAGQYGGKMAVFLGKEKTGIFAGVYAMFFAIDNGELGKSSVPDQVCGFLLEWPILEELRDFYNQMEADDLINYFGILDCDKGNVTVK